MCADKLERNCWHDGRPYDPHCIECQKFIYQMLREAEQDDCLETNHEANHVSDVLDSLGEKALRKAGVL